MIYRFADCVVDIHRHQLHRNGDLIKTEPKVFTVLAYLLERRNELITRDRLLDACWPGMYVCESSLTRCLSRVRRTIGHSKQRKLVETVHRKGYRFVGEVEELEQADNPTETDELGSAGALAGVETRNEACAVMASRTERPNAEVLFSCAPSGSIAAAAPQESCAGTVESAALASDVFLVDRQWRAQSVLFCRRVAEQDERDLDIEQLYEREQAFRQLCLECFSPFGGHLTQSLQGGYLFYFGSTDAHDDGATPAAAAALALSKRLQRGERSGEAVPLRAQMGIHTGMVMVETAGAEHGRALLICGPTELIATQLGKVAEPQQLIISASTAGLIGEEFVAHHLNRPGLPGQREALTCYTVAYRSASAITEPAREECNNRAAPGFVSHHVRPALGTAGQMQYT